MYTYIHNSAATCDGIEPGVLDCRGDRIVGGLLVHGELLYALSLLGSREKRHLHTYILDRISPLIHTYIHTYKQILYIQINLYCETANGSLYQL